MDTWWEVDYAKSNRSKCKNCKQTIAEGEPRIGISSEQHDHGGGSGFGGWFHVVEGCFLVAKRWRDVPSLNSLKDVRDWRDLEDDVAKTISDFLKGKAAPSSPKKTLKIVAQKVFVKKNTEGNIEVRGDTFDIKDDLKAKLGARWEPTSRLWVVPSTREEDAKKFFNLPRIEAFEQHPNPPDDLDEPEERIVRRNNSANDDDNDREGSPVKTRAKRKIELNEAKDAADTTVTKKGKVAVEGMAVENAEKKKAKTDAKFDNEFDLDQTIPRLKLECTRRGLMIKGTKPEIQARLKADIEAREKHPSLYPLADFVFSGAGKEESAYILKAGGALVAGAMSGSTEGCCHLTSSLFKRLNGNIDQAILFRQDMQKLASSLDDGFVEAVKFNVPIVHFDWSEEFNLGAFFDRFAVAEEGLAASKLKPLDKSEVMSIETFKARTLALWPGQVVWPPFKEALVHVERPQCKGGCGFFGTPETGYCSRCQPQTNTNSQNNSS